MKYSVIRTSPKDPTRFAVVEDVPGQSSAVRYTSGTRRAAESIVKRLERGLPIPSDERPVGTLADVGALR